MTQKQVFLTPNERETLNKTIKKYDKFEKQLNELNDEIKDYKNQLEKYYDNNPIPGMTKQEFVQDSVNKRYKDKLSKLNGETTRLYPKKVKAENKLANELKETKLAEKVVNLAIEIAETDKNIDISKVYDKILSGVPDGGYNDTKPEFLKKNYQNILGKLYNSLHTDHLNKFFKPVTKKAKKDE